MGYGFCAEPAVMGGHARTHHGDGTFRVRWGPASSGIKNHRRVRQFPQGFRVIPVKQSGYGNARPGRQFQFPVRVDDAFPGGDAPGQFRPDARHGRQHGGGGFQNKFRRGEGAHQAHDPDRAKSRYQVQGDGGFLRCHGEGLISRYTSRWAWIMSLIL